MLHLLPPFPPPSSLFSSVVSIGQTFAEETAADLHISYVIDTNLGLSSNPATVATAHIAAVNAAGLWPLVQAVEVGNECDLYFENGHRPANYNYSDYAVSTSTVLLSLLFVIWSPF